MAKILRASKGDRQPNRHLARLIGSVVATTMVAGHDVIRGSGPNQGAALMNRVTLHGFSQSNGSTVSHHLVFTPAIRERYIYMARRLMALLPSPFYFHPLAADASAGVVTIGWGR